MSDAPAALTLLLEAQVSAPRGPRREGMFALWLFARVALDMADSADESLRTDRRRLALLQKRLATLAVAPPLARGLTAAMIHLSGGTRQAARVALSQLVAPARETLSNEVGEAVAVLARQLYR